MRNAGWSSDRDRNCPLFVELALPTKIENTKCRVAALLDLCNHHAGTDRVNCPGRHEDGLARRHALPPNKTRYRPVVDGFLQLLRREPFLQAESDLRVGVSTKDVPCFGFAMRQTDRMGIGIVRMDLDGKRLAGEEQLKQEQRIACRCVSRSNQISPIGRSS